MLHDNFSFVKRLVHQLTVCVVSVSIDQELISIRALVFDLAQLTCQRNNMNFRINCTSDAKMSQGRGSLTPPTECERFKIRKKTYAVFTISLFRIAYFYPYFKFILLVVVLFFY